MNKVEEKFTLDEFKKAETIRDTLAKLMLAGRVGKKIVIIGAIPVVKDKILKLAKPAAKGEAYYQVLYMYAASVQEYLDELIMAGIFGCSKAKQTAVMEKFTTSIGMVKVGKPDSDQVTWNDVLATSAFAMKLNKENLGDNVGKLAAELKITGAKWLCPGFQFIASESECLEFLSHASALDLDDDVTASMCESACKVIIARFPGTKSKVEKFIKKQKLSIERQIFDKNLNKYVARKKRMTRILSLQVELKGKTKKLKEKEESDEESEEEEKQIEEKKEEKKEKSKQKVRESRREAKEKMMFKDEVMKKPSKDEIFNSLDSMSDEDKVIALKLLNKEKN